MYCCVSMVTVVGRIRHNVTFILHYIFAYYQQAILSARYTVSALYYQHAILSARYT
jgi:hypothetical protein